MELSSFYTNRAALHSQFHWASSIESRLSAGNVGASLLQSLAAQYRGVMSSMGSYSAVSQFVGFAAMPDFFNSGRLEVDKSQGVVTTPGGYQVAVKDGQVKILSPNGKWTDLKAEPPTRTLESSSTATETRTQTTLQRTLPGDPVVRESDGDVWRYQGTGTFALPDGTKITIRETGEDKDIHINQVDIYNGNKHVSVASNLKSAEWETVKRDVSQSATDWTTNASSTRWVGRSEFRDDQQSRQVTTNVTEHQQVKQTFDTQFSDVTNDGFLHDALTDDGQKFRVAGDGDDWKQRGREVISGAGKGQDDATKAYQLGDRIDSSWLGARPVEVPWNIYSMSIMTRVDGMFQNQYGRSQSHWDDLRDTFAQFQRRPYLGAVARMDNYGGLNSIYAGPMGGSAFFGAGYAGGVQFGASFSSMQASFGGLLNTFGELSVLQQSVSRNLGNYWVR